jgi:hypothetical protein
MSAVYCSQRKKSSVTTQYCGSSIYYGILITMKLQALLPMIAPLGLLGGCSQSGQSGTDNAKKYTNPERTRRAVAHRGNKGKRPDKATP